MGQFEKYWLLLAVAIGLALFLYIFFPERFRPIFQYVTGTFSAGDGIWMTLRLTMVSFIFILIVTLVQWKAQKAWVHT